ncbi:MAG TPA: TraR/DksA C4-type zinc finger protein [Balneolales bacterium]|nr:TraR/DksA C4-type zinc finger protein [Balneolales bacterium]
MEASKKEEAKDQNKISPYSDEELEYFRQIILKKRKEAEEDLEMLQQSLKNSMENSTDDSAYSFHMADAGTDAQEREKTYMLFNRTRKFIKYLDAALERIDNKTYGICKVTGKKISKGRLEAVPHTQISIEAKLKRR